MEYCIVEEAMLNIKQISEGLVRKGTHTLRISLKNPTEREIGVQNAEVKIDIA